MFQSFIRSMFLVLQFSGLHSYSFIYKSFLCSGVFLIKVAPNFFGGVMEKSDIIEIALTDYIKRLAKQLRVCTTRLCNYGSSARLDKKIDSLRGEIKEAAKCLPGFASCDICLDPRGCPVVVEFKGGERQFFN
jgi:hypothetical protein